MKLETFELVDRVEQLDLAEGWIRAHGIVPPAENKLFEGHFPGYAVLPGVLMVEFMAQTAGWLVLARGGFNHLGVLASVKEAKIRNAVPPAAEIAAEAKVVHEGSGYTVISARVLNSRKLVADAELTLRALPVPNEEFMLAMRKRARVLGLLVEA
jgi:3-hydroxyacyl-[acyl-carrier-protein] dehydratase